MTEPKGACMKFALVKLVGKHSFSRAVKLVMLPLKLKLILVKLGSKHTFAFQIGEQK